MADMPSQPLTLELRVFPVTRLILGWLRRVLIATVEGAGQMANLIATLFGYVIRGRANVTATLQQAAFVGVDTLGISLTLTGFAAMVIALQVAKEMAKQGASSFVGALVSLAMVRELGPILTSFSIIAMAGSAYAAELATMKVNNQLDALKVLQVSPIRYLVLPRVLAFVIMVPLVTVLTTSLGLYAGQWVSQWSAEIPPSLYWQSVWQQTDGYDVVAALVKAAVFGASSGLIACVVGLNAGKHARAVGEATTRAVVVSFITMAILDYVLTQLFYANFK